MGRQPGFLLSIITLLLLYIATGPVAAQITNFTTRQSALLALKSHITSAITPHLGNLSFLAELRFRNNSFYGTLPHEWARLRLLKLISLAFNKFSGTIPAWLRDHISNTPSGRRMDFDPTKTALQPQLLWRRFSHLQLLRSTNGFHESNLLGTGGFVYKGAISDGIYVAVKVFNLQIEGAFKSFDSECDVLSNIRH
ncbi:hypothetical protein L3X38_009825 [Prunus dulcis]|uniref:Leucine-rich repeat protein kinase family protein n=1 Tax=Prunus dulcis TaxID=3755 RepID=A0AAD4ZDG5_PRUDU|nr:hypothetical protein L3X38_009825 [Prunus dulcis]